MLQNNQGNYVSVTLHTKNLLWSGLDYIKLLVNKQEVIAT